MTESVAVPALPSVFLCYRRADEPFATALFGTVLADRLGKERIFLDTVTLDRGREFAARLIAGARGADVMLVVIGGAWDRGRNRGRLADPDDWVRREVLEARAAGRHIVPVLVERNLSRLDAPDELAFLGELTSVELRRPDVAGGLARIADEVTGVPAAAPASRCLDRGIVERATLAMVGHVLPDRQQFGGNDAAVARVVAEHLAPGEWLRFAGAGNSPGRPGGSGVVMVTDGQLRLVELRPRPGVFTFGVEAGGVTSRLLGPGTVVRAVPRRSRGRDLVDVHVGGPGVELLSVLGLFRRPAEILLEVAERSVERPGN